MHKKPKPSIFHKIGLAGLANDEHPIAIKLGQVFNVAVAGFILLIPILWFLHENQSAHVVKDWVDFASWLIWLVLTFEITLMMIFVRDRWRYLKSNWLNIPIVILTFPLILSIIPYAIVLRIVQFMLFARYLSEMQRVLQRLFKVSQLGAIMLGFFSIVLLGGILIHSIDPSIASVEDGWWWALSTMATVGYGDVVPKSTEGRAFGALIIILGAVFFSLLTAQLAAYLVGEEELMRERDILNVVRENQKTLLAIQAKDDAHIEQTLLQLQTRIATLENLLTHYIAHEQNKNEDKQNESSE